MDGKTHLAEGNLGSHESDMEPAGFVSQPQIRTSNNPGLRAGDPAQNQTMKCQVSNEYMLPMHIF